MHEENIVHILFKSNLITRASISRIFSIFHDLQVDYSPKKT